MHATPQPSTPTRLVPELPLPPYGYVPGRFPHPITDPAGHSYGHVAQQPPPVDQQNWHESSPFLFGCDLFNHGYYWEAHEAWEGVWMACGRHGTTATFLKGLIKLAAAGVKAREGRAAGVARHATRAAELLHQVRNELAADRYCGLDLAELEEIARNLAAAPVISANNDAAVEIVFPWRLSPQLP